MLRALRLFPQDSTQPASKQLNAQEEENTEKKIPKLLGIKAEKCGSNYARFIEASAMWRSGNMKTRIKRSLFVAGNSFDIAKRNQFYSSKPNALIRAIE